MHNGGVRIVDYSPNTHTLLIYSEIEHVQHQLTQTHLLSLVDEESKKTALHILNNMDNLTQQPVKAAVKSTLRIKGGKPLCLYFSFVPSLDANGQVTHYFGMCRDISDIKATEEQLARETVKAQEVETVKNAFLRNMSYEIRTPLASVLGFAELFMMDHQPEDEAFFIEEIKKNSRNLLNLVNNILFLSRLDAGMIEFKTEPIDFASVFEGRCHSVWIHYEQPDVDYIVDSPYKYLELEIDLTNLGIVIEHVVTNAVQHTTSGSVRASYDYNGEDLTITTDIIREQHPDLAEAWEKALDSNLLHLGSIAIMKTEDWREMFAVAWSVANEYLKRIGGDIVARVKANEKAYHIGEYEFTTLTHEIRVGGQICERIVSAWMDWKFPNAAQFSMLTVADKIEVPFIP